MIIYGLIGNPLTHSWSAKYFSSKFKREKLSDKIYKLFPLSSIDEFPGLIKHEKELAGLNVTIPFKQKIIGFLDETDPVAQAIGAVNTIKISRQGDRIILKGFNTDAHGFQLSADFSGHSKALILGTGGAAKAVAFALTQLGIESLFVSRTKKNTQILIYPEISGEVMFNHTLIINATPAGMYPDTNAFPFIPYEFLTEKHFLYDLVYNPGQTRFLQKGLEYGAKIQNGISMLKIQAELSFKIWETPNTNNFTSSV